MIEEMILTKLIPYVIPALMINIILDFIKKNFFITKPKLVMPIFALLLSLFVSVIYSMFDSSSGLDRFTHAISIIGISFFMYDIGGYKSMKTKLLKLVTRK